jgi:hypothetical protein
MAVTISAYNNLKSDILNGGLDLDTDTINVVLVTSSYTFSAAHAKRSEITAEVANGNGYTTGGAALGSKTVAAGVFDAADVVWANSSITARGAIITKVTGTSSADPLIAYVNFGEDKVSESGNFTITWNASGILSVA